MRRRIGSVLRIVYSLCGLIGLLARCGQSREAAIIAAAVRRECGTHGLVVDEGTQSALAEALAIVHSSLQTHELESARVQGEALALDDVVKLALAA